MEHTIQSMHLNYGKYTKRRCFQIRYNIQRTKMFPQPASNNWLSSLMLTVSGRKNDGKKMRQSEREWREKKSISDRV